MIAESLRMNANWSVITTISSAGIGPGTYRAPTQRSRNHSLTSRKAAPAAVAISHVPAIDCERTAAARVASPAPIRPPRPGMTAEITIATTLKIASGT